MFGTGIRTQDAPSPGCHPNHSDAQEGYKASTLPRYINPPSCLQSGFGKHSLLLRSVLFRSPQVSKEKADRRGQGQQIPSHTLPRAWGPGGHCDGSAGRLGVEEGARMRVRAGLSLLALNLVPPDSPPPQILPHPHPRLYPNPAPAARRLADLAVCEPPYWAWDRLPRAASRGPQWHPPAAARARAFGRGQER